MKKRQAPLAGGGDSGGLLSFLMAGWTPRQKACQVRTLSPSDRPEGKEGPELRGRKSPWLNSIPEGRRKREEGLLFYEGTATWLCDGLK